ncbi:response regulator transcription factor [Streptomyces sp. NPDC012935]|uniref:response regulator transcription factor n=1 Tax=Streptomyces sp. NPDC012935 TaxID=3364857 RepID=UPI0036A75979
MLTPRQRQILSLAAEGHSNHAIAEELVLSARTVERHMSSILNRLGAGNRTPPCDGRCNNKIEVRRRITRTGRMGHDDSPAA